MATDFSIFAWRIPWTKESGGLQFMESKSLTQLKRQHTHTPSPSIPEYLQHPKISLLPLCRQSSVLPLAKATTDWLPSSAFFRNLTQMESHNM